MAEAPGGNDECSGYRKDEYGLHRGDYFWNIFDSSDHDPAIIFSVRAGDLGESLFGASGAAGLLFYGSVLLAVFMFVTGRRMPGTVILAVMFGIPLLMIALKEPLSGMLKRHRPELKEGKLMFFVRHFLNYLRHC